MRILALADTQLGAGRQLADDRLADQEAALDRIASLAHERDVDVVLHLGDVFETRHPGEEERMVFKRWAHKVTGLSEPETVKGYQGMTDWTSASGPSAIRKDAGVSGSLSARLIVLAGNHDLRNASLASAVDLYDRCEFVRVPTVLDLGGCSLACLPWAPIHNLAAARDSREGVYEQAAEALVAIARDLRSQCPAGKPAILAAHWAISGASLPSGLPVDDLGEVVVPYEPLAGYAQVLAGHIHQRGWFQANAIYAGSPYPCSFGETGDTHGVWIWDSEDAFGDGLGSVEFVETPSRPLITINVDFRIVDWAVGGDAELAEIAGADDSTAVIVAQFKWHDLTDATVRLRYTASEEQHRRVDIPAIRRVLADAGAHKLYSVEPTILRENRARAQGVDENLEPQQALAAWCEANQIEAGKREALAGLLERWEAEA